MLRLCFGIFCLMILLASLHAAAQDSAQRIPIPMKNGLVWYESSGEFRSTDNRKHRFLVVMNWYRKNFSGAEHKVMRKDEKNGELIFTGAFRVNTSATGNYYWLMPEFEIQLNDSGYDFRAGKYFEKPIEKGITNDYSKIEYRWRDYRKGHPWSTEDTLLFEGLNSKTLALEESLKEELLKAEK